MSNEKLSNPFGKLKTLILCFNIIITKFLYFLYQNSNMLLNDLERGSAVMERGSMTWEMETNSKSRDLGLAKIYFLI